MQYEPEPVGVIEKILPDGSFKTSKQPEQRRNHVLWSDHYCELFLSEDEETVIWSTSSRNRILAIGMEVYTHPLNATFWTLRDQCIGIGLTTI